MRILYINSCSASVTRWFRVLIRRRNRPGQSDLENGIRPGQSDSKTGQRAHERSRKNQAASARERDLTVRKRERDVRASITELGCASPADRARPEKNGIY